MCQLNQTPNPVNSERQHLREALKQLLDRQRKIQPRTEFCKDCGSTCEFLTAQLWFDGDEETFSVGLPFCPDCNPELLPRAFSVS